MKIGLIDIDSKIPNLALMKLSAYHKSKGDDVEWWKGTLFHSQYDKVYASKVFDFSKLPYDLPKDIDIGGSGIDINKKLPDEVEQESPDYTIYPDCDYSIQLFSRGCYRKCKFCIVPEKEGNINPVIPMKLNPNGKWIRVLDNSFFANPNWKEAVKYLKETNLPVFFESIDARILKKEQAIELNNIKLYKQIHMAWDNPEDDIDWFWITDLVSAYKIMVYILIGYNTTRQDDMYRVQLLRALNIDPFVMPYNKHDPYQKRFARWVNHKAIFKSVEWKDYNTIDRIPVTVP